MAEFRTVDPRTLRFNPNNPRRTPSSPETDAMLDASITALGAIIQPPVVHQDADGLEIKFGERRVRAALRLKLPEIPVLVMPRDAVKDAMGAVVENTARAPLPPVDQWRAIETLEAQGWTEQAVADALALPVRTVKRLKLLGHLHPPMLDLMAKGSMPSEDQLRTIAAAPAEEQAQVWKKLKPKKGHEVSWYEISRALSKRRIPFAAAKFDDDLARAYGVVWEDDLFAPAGEDGRYTTNAEGFFGAQQEWLANNLPERGTLLPQDEYGRPQLPKKAEYVHGKLAKGDCIGHYLDQRTGEVRSVAYRIPTPKKPAKAGTAASSGDTADDTGGIPARTRPDVTQKGQAMIGDLRTDALHEALRDSDIEDHTLLGLLVLAFAGNNVSVHSGADLGASDRNRIAASVSEAGVLTSDSSLLRIAAREMLVAVLSCRDNMTNSGDVARIAGDAVSADLRLPNMATEAFLSCLSKAALERAAIAEGVRVEARGKDTRARMVERFAGGLYVHPAARFVLTEAEVKARADDITTHEAWPRNNGAEAPSDPDAGDGAEGGANAGAWDDLDGSAAQIAAE